MIMASSILKNIYFEIARLREQAPVAAVPDPNAATPAAAPPAVPASAPAPVASPVAPPPQAAAAGATPDPMAAATDPNAAAGGEIPEQDAEADSESAGGEDKEPNGQPPVNKEDPIAGVFDYAKELAGKTINIDTILTGVKASIQSNFGGNYEAAWPVVQRLKDTENRILIDVANRLSLFISGTIQENKNKGKRPMKISKQEIRKLVHEAVKNASITKKQKNVSLTEKQFENVVRNVVSKRLKEGALFDTYRSQIDKEQSAIEQQLTSADIRRMAIDLFEKICDKTGVDVDSDNPESPAMQFVKAELDRMVTSAQEVANKLIQVATVVRTASDGAPKKEEGQG